MTLHEVPKRYQKLYKLALSGRSRTASIKAMCLECQGWDAGCRAAVRDCAATGCPLHSVRPFQVKKTDAP